ncbi:MAG: Gfo/Idh/MocA family oxidoreductase [Fimbriimonadaceae bacterium]|nr:Gfo/Idh/MocA family oxidoreductase [Fimbriimonadaceae bacterium]
MQQARVAQVGIGGYGASIRGALVAAENVAYQAVCDLDQALCEQVAAETGAAVRSFDEILADPAIQAVAVVLPNHLHRPYVERIAAAGKHVFCEKPIANHTADGAAMIQACREAGVILMIGHNYRREATFRQAREWLEAAAIGTLIDAQGESSHAGGLQINPATWRFDPTLCPALPLIQLGVHVIDFLNHCLGRPVEVSGLQRHRVIPGNNVDATVSCIAYESGVLATVASHYCTPGRTEVLFSGLGGRVQVNGGKASLHTKAGVTAPEIARLDSRLEECREFAAAVLGQTTVETPGEAGLWALAVCEAATLSQRERRTVALAELPGMAVVA